MGERERAERFKFKYEGLGGSRLGLDHEVRFFSLFFSVRGCVRVYSCTNLLLGLTRGGGETAGLFECMCPSNAMESVPDVCL